VLTELHLCSHNYNGSLLTAVGEIVITGAHVVVSSLAKSKHDSLVRSWGVVELSLHLVEALSVYSEVGDLRSLIQAFALLYAPVVSRRSEVDGEIFSLNPGLAVVDPHNGRSVPHGRLLERKRVVLVQVLDLNNVVSVSA